MECRANYDGVFTIDVEPAPKRHQFVEGPEAGNWSYGIYELEGDALTICLGVVGASRPAVFKTTAGSGHALEKLRRSSNKQPVNVTGGTKPAAAPDATPAPAKVDPRTFDVPMTPLLRSLEGEWAAMELVMDGELMRAEWLAFGSRQTVGNDMKVISTARRCRTRG
jgi:hypothetical protein